MLAGARLRLREWRDTDREAYAALNADPAVRRWLGPVLTRAQSDAQIDRFVAHQAAHGFCFWCLEIPGLADCAGFVGLQHLGADDPVSEGVEIGWRLARAHWGQGYATEAARLCVAHGFGALGLPQILAWATAGNLASIRVMERLGMELVRRFDHPRLPPGDPLREHVLYRLPRPPGL